MIRVTPRGRIVVSHGLASIGMSLPWPLLLTAVWDATGDEALLGVTGAARMLPYVLFSWWVAGVADRWGRRRVVGLTLWARIGLLAGAGIVLLTLSGAAALFVAVLLCALAVAAGTPAYPALVAGLPDAGPGNARQATNLLVTVEVASFVVGPALGGLLLGRVQPWVVMGIAALLTVLALVLLAPVGLPLTNEHSSDEARPRIVALILTSMRVRGAIAAICVINLVGSGLLVALVPIADERWASETAYGQATAAFGFGALAAPAIWWLGRTATRRVHLGMAAFALALVLLVPTSALVAALVVLFVGGACAVHVEAAATELLQASVPDQVRAGVLGVTDALMVGAAMIGSFVGPMLVGALGGSAVLFVLAGVTVVAGAIALPVVRESLASEPDSRYSTAPRPAAEYLE